MEIRGSVFQDGVSSTGQKPKGAQTSPRCPGRRKGLPRHLRAPCAVARVAPCFYPRAPRSLWGPPSPPTVPTSQAGLFVDSGQRQAQGPHICDRIWAQTSALCRRPSGSPMESISGEPSPPGLCCHHPHLTGEKRRPGGTVSQGGTQAFPPHLGGLEGGVSRLDGGVGPSLA